MEGKGEESGRECRVEGGEAGAGGVEGDKKMPRERGGLGEEREGEGEGEMRRGKVSGRRRRGGEEKVRGEEGVLRGRGGSRGKVVVAAG